MHCASCQREIADYSNFCYYCGQRQTTWRPATAGRQLSRPPHGRMIGGVCAGFAEHYSANVTVMRILMVFVTLATGILPGVVTYIVAWILLPVEVYLPSPAAGPRPEPPPAAAP